ncbi:hypothetical protein LINPERPRIM_LOCUS30271 [Linum perenne]
MTAATVSSNSWASVVGSDPDPDLEYFPPILIDGVLQIPSEVVDLGIKKFESALVGQFLGPSPPLRVFQSLANRLWDYDGFVSVSELSSGSFLIEFPTVSVCEWVLARLWHVHHLPLFLKRWSLDVTPICLQPKEVPVWIQLSKVPVPLCTHAGVGRLASLIGKPISKFVRNGTTVKVCVLMDDSAEKPSSLSVAVAGIQHVVEVDYPQSRVYSSKKVDGVKKVPQRTTVWQQKMDVAASAAGNDGEPSSKGEASPAKELVVSAEQEAPGSVPKPLEKREGSPGTEKGGSKHQLGSPADGNLATDTSDGTLSGGDDKEKSKTLQLVDPLSPEFFPPLGKRGNRRGRKR